MIKTENYIHEKELENMITRLWDEIYNHEPFTPYDENYLKSLYSDLFKFDREDTWIINNVLIIEYDLWTKAYNEHFLIINLIGRIGAYIEEPFDYIDALYKPFSDDEKEKYMKEWGLNNMRTILNQGQAMKAVETACNHILTDSLSVEGKLLMFDSFSQSVVMWVSAGLIEYDWLDSLLDYIIDIKEIYLQEIRRQSVKRVRR